MEIDLVILFLGMSIVSFIPRWLPLFFLSGKKMPDWFKEWLELIPVAILSAILLPELVTLTYPRSLNIFNIKFAVAIPTFIFALKTKSMGGTIIIGMFLFWISKIIL